MGLRPVLFPSSWGSGLALSPSRGAGDSALSNANVPVQQAGA